MSAQSDAQRQLEALSEEYQRFQTELQTNIAARQRLEAQQQENTSVRKEFDSLAEGSDIYKLVGPVLLKQERSEAISSVDSRLDFISNETKRVESQIKSIQEKSEQKKGEIFQLQNQLQQQQ